MGVYVSMCECTCDGILFVYMYVSVCVSACESVRVCVTHASACTLGSEDCFVSQFSLSTFTGV